MAEAPKVPKDKFEAAIRALLNTPPTPLADIPRKREPKQMNGPRNKDHLGAKIKRQPPPLPRDSQGPTLAKRPPGALGKPPNKRV